MPDTPNRPRRPGGTPSGKRPDSGRPAKGKPYASGGPRKPGTPRAGGSGRRPDDNEKRLWTRDGKPARGDRSAREREPREDRDPLGLRPVRARHDDPIVPEDVSDKDLDRIARNQLKTLSKENAEGVAKHLVMAAKLIDSDPALAHQHAVSAARRAGRIAVVRETLAITAYTIGDYALALRELRTYRRISGKDDQVPMMVDCERGLGRPDRALELGRSVPRATLPPEVAVELAIAMSGARLDLGQLDAALAELEIPQLDPDTAFSYSPALFSAYATVLEDLGRDAEATQWFDRADVAVAALMAAADDGEGVDDELEIIDVEDDADEDAEDGAEAARQEPSQEQPGDV